MSLLDSHRRSRLDMQSVTTPRGATLPLKQYFALLTYLSCLLITSFIFLPRSSWFFPTTDLSTLAPRSSADRPEHRFLTTLTVSPLGTMMWSTVGVIVCMMWWGQHLKSWWTVPSESPTRPSRHERVKVTGTVSTSQRSKNPSHWLLRLAEAALATSAASFVITALFLGLGAPLDEYVSRI